LDITVFYDGTPCCVVQCTGISEEHVVSAISSFLVYPDDGGWRASGMLVQFQWTAQCKSYAWKCLSYLWIVIPYEMDAAGKFCMQLW